MKLIGKFTKIIWKSNNDDLLIVNLKIAPNQNEQKLQLSIKDSANSINVFIKSKHFEFKLNYELDIEKQPSQKYGFSYHVKSFVPIYKNDEESALAFLSSKLFYGISTTSAKKIIDNIGIKFLDNPKQYEKEIINLIGDKKAQIIIEGILSQNEYQNIYKIFIDKSLSMNLLNIINEIIDRQKLLEFISSDQLFSMIEKVDNIDFLDLNNIAKIFNKNYSEQSRNKWLIIWSIYQNENNGSSIIEIKNIYELINKYFEIDKNEYIELLKDLINKKIIIANEDNKSVTLAQTYEKEKYVCETLDKISKKLNTVKISKEDLITSNLDTIQIEALFNSLSNNVSIITGSPGTGKTLIISLLIQNLEKLNFKKIELLAPTGKAATQISEKTARGAKTIHSFLKYNKIDFDVNAKNPSDVEVIIIDEFSMIDIKIFYSILVACPKLQKIILIGDKDQLPSIKCGYLLNDLISSKKFQVSTLNKIYRQDEGSNIINNALKINQSIFPSFNNNETKMISCINEEQIYEEVKKYIEEYLLKNKNLNNQQILIPMYNGMVGIDNINKMVQLLVNRENLILFTLKQTAYYKNDKVIQLENDLDKNVFNGEIGYINSVIFDNEKNEISKILIMFDKKIITYTPSEFNISFKLAYAISIHKFQGSECNDVLLILGLSHISMISKKLFYTAYTRAMKSITLISNNYIIEKAIFNDRDSQRRTNIIFLLTNNK